MGKQLDLYPPKLYDGKPPSVRGSDTSEAAAESVRKPSARIRQSVFEVVEAAGLRGVTCDGVEEKLDGRHQTISARVRELVQLGQIRDSGRRRKTRSGRTARVYVVTKGAR